AGSTTLDESLRAPLDAFLEEAPQVPIVWDTVKRKPTASPIQAAAISQTAMQPVLVLGHGLHRHKVKIPPYGFLMIWMALTAARGVPPPFGKAWTSRSPLRPVNTT